MDIKPGKNISRRNFIKASAITVVSATGANALAATAPETPTAASQSGRVIGYCGEGDWLGAAPVIPDADVAKNVDVDVLVLGGGHAGLLAALGASDNGAKVAVVEALAEKAFDTYWGRVGEDIGHVNSKWLIKRGYGPYNTGEIVAEFVKRAAGRCNQEIVRLYVENSGPMFDRMAEVYEEYKDLRKKNDSAVAFKYGGAGGGPGGAPGGAGGAPGGAAQGAAAGSTTVTYDFSNIMSEEMLINQVQKGVKPKDYPIELGGYKTWPCNAQFMGPTLRKPAQPFVSVLRWFEKYHVQKTIDQGADWYYETNAVVLTQEADGAVTGAIVKDAAGKYIKFKARKGVILATGGFQGNPEMCWALLNESQEWAERGGMKKGKLASGSFAGQGHKMGCWAGGMIEPSPRGYMGGGGGVSGPWGISPMLQLNANAKRFCNEAAAPLAGQAAQRQPKGILCLVTDKKFMKSVEISGLEHGGPNYGRPVYYEDMEEDMGKVLGTGAKGGQVRCCRVAERELHEVYASNTLEELAGYLGYTGDLVKTFVESVKHYNDLCKKGVDNEFGKDAKAMIPVNEPPFYGCKGQNGGGMMMSLGGSATMSGLLSDEKLRVLNKDGKPIKGLFACGNTLGGRYGLGYCTPFAGNSIGMALTHGWLAGKFASSI
jgi:succinate dehydrogenase/fumarate reductase flavoprotein subunit